MIKYKTFISYDFNQDQRFRNILKDIYASVDVVGSMELKGFDTTLNTETIQRKIREIYLQDSIVTIVLIGKDTWRIRDVDWTIASSLKDTKSNPRSGLVGIILPTHPSHEKLNYDYCTMPPRLYDNLKNNFAKIHQWSTDKMMLQEWLDQAIERKIKILPSNSRNLFKKNRSLNRGGWC